MTTVELYSSEPSLPTVTAETSLEASVTLYLRAGAPTAARDRQTNVRMGVEVHVDAGLLPDHGVEEWPSKAVVPNDGPTDPAVETYDEFADAAAARSDVHLGPFFEDRPGIGRSDRVVLPMVCVGVRRDDELTGLYPCWNGETTSRSGTGSWRWSPARTSRTNRIVGNTELFASVSPIELGRTSTAEIRHPEGPSPS